ncbi:hypothetical protein CYMTET_17359 [Cymbomonas tetramitiformis]|uniref:Uncharacterized protein n=1 Tax=Cymbomonas tetramitiformis TaxID=36881 RepID=A0AAE0L718_9CHLO|nr:hypothetical protein CYMTET_17359 [Cymbomonas tetramitiformis]
MRTPPMIEGRLRTALPVDAHSSQDRRAPKVPAACREGLVLEPGGYMVLYRDANCSFEFGLSSEDQVYLFNGTRMLDWVAWTTSTAAPKGMSLSRVPNLRGPLLPRTPTPGEPNTPAPPESPTSQSNPPSTAAPSQSNPPSTAAPSQSTSPSASSPPPSEVGSSLPPPSSDGTSTNEALADSGGAESHCRAIWLCALLLLSTSMLFY